MICSRSTPPRSRPNQSRREPSVHPSRRHEAGRCRRCETDRLCALRCRSRLQEHRLVLRLPSRRPRGRATGDMPVVWRVPPVAARNRPVRALLTGLRRLRPRPSVQDQRPLSRLPASRRDDRREVDVSSLRQGRVHPCRDALVRVMLAAALPAAGDPTVLGVRCPQPKTRRRHVPSVLDPQPRPPHQPGREPDRHARQRTRVARALRRVRR